MTTIKAKDQDLGSFPGMLWELRLYPVARKCFLFQIISNTVKDWI